MSEYNPKQYFCNRRRVAWGEDLPSDVVASMKDGEIVILLDGNSMPYVFLMYDSFGKIRENYIAWVEAGGEVQPSEIERVVRECNHLVETEKQVVPCYARTPFVTQS